MPGMKMPRSQIGLCAWYGEAIHKLHCILISYVQLSGSVTLMSCLGCKGVGTFPENIKILDFNSECIWGGEMHVKKPHWFLGFG